MTLPLTATTAPYRLSELAEEALLKRICVSKPYYALVNPTGVGSTFYASATADLPLEAEVGPMSSAEISRHAAISGLCAAALAQNDDDRRFYLAQRAEYRGVANGAAYGSPVTFAATLQSLSKRGARAQIVVQAGAKPLAKLVVDYTILTEYAFSRLFRTHYRPTTPQAVMDNSLSGRAQSSGDRSVYDVPALPETVCAGHFADYPALPVALLMGQLGKVAWPLLDSARWRGVWASVNATDLCWAGERVRFEATRPAFSAAHPIAAHPVTEKTVVEKMQHTFSCRVSAEDRLVCTAELGLEAL